MALDFAADGFVNAICPSAIQTGMIESLFKSQEKADKTLRNIARSISLSHVGPSEDIASVAYFLASADGSYMIGATPVIDGDLLSRLAI